MISLMLVAVYSLYEYFVAGEAFAKVFQTATDVLFYWYLICFVFSVFWLAFVLACGLFNLSLFKQQTDASRAIINIGAKLTGLSFLAIIIRYSLLLFGVAAIQASYNGEELRLVVLIFGAFMLLVGLLFKSKAKRRRRVTFR